MKTRKFLLLLLAVPVHFAAAWGFMDLLDLAPWLGSIARLSESGVKAICGDSKGASEALALAGMNIAFDAGTLLTGGAAYGARLGGSAAKVGLRKAAQKGIASTVKYGAQVARVGGTAAKAGFKEAARQGVRAGVKESVKSSSKAIGKHVAKTATQQGAMHVGTSLALRNAAQINVKAHKDLLRLERERLASEAPADGSDSGQTGQSAENQPQDERVREFVDMVKRGAADRRKGKPSGAGPGGSGDGDDGDDGDDRKKAVDEDKAKLISSRKKNKMRISQRVKNGQKRREKDAKKDAAGEPTGAEAEEDLFGETRVRTEEDDDTLDETMNQNVGDMLDPERPGQDVGEGFWYEDGNWWGTKSGLRE